MNMLSVVDPLQNEVFFDRDSIGIAILNSEINTYAHGLLKVALKHPAAIIEVSHSRRVYLFINESYKVHVVNVIFKDNFWYADNVNIEVKNDEILDIVEKNKTIYKK